MGDDDPRCVANIKLLHGVHIERYERMLAAHNRGVTGYRPRELTGLLHIWHEVGDRGFDYAALSEEARSEVEDAIADV